jgi:hypothetical protein
MEPSAHSPAQRLPITSTGHGLAGWQPLSSSRSTPPARQTTQQTQSVNLYTIIHEQKLNKNTATKQFDTTIKLNVTRRREPVRYSAY